MSITPLANSKQESFLHLYRMHLFYLIKLSRPKQWTKNVFVLSALFFSQQLFVVNKIMLSLFTFIAFCLISSAVYVLNDIVDLKKDQLHPKKKFRPLAAGHINIKNATIYGIMILIVSLFLAISISINVFYILSLYFVLNISYSFWLKHIVLIDVFIIAIGFVLRVMAGSLALPVNPSPWLLLCTLLLALFLGLCKRKSEIMVLQDNAGDHRRILDDYNDKLLDQLISLVSATTIMAYSLYTFNSSNGTYLMYTIPIVVYSIFRYFFLVYKKDRGGEPANILLGDKSFLGSCILWLVVTFGILYL